MTLLDRRHLVHTFNLCGVPSINALTFWMLGLKTRLLRFIQWVTWRPIVAVLPQISHAFAIEATSSRTEYKTEARWDQLCGRP